MRSIVFLVMVLALLPLASAQFTYSQVRQTREIAQGAAQPLPPAVHIPVVLSTPPTAATLPHIYKTRLICPKVPKTKMHVLPLPWGANDCTLVGKGKEIEEFLTAMENRAATCKARRAAMWKQVLTAKAGLDKQVDALENPPLTGKEVKTTALSSCPSYGSPESLTDEFIAQKNQHYTQWLKDIERDVNKYCKLVDELMKPMWTACDMINFYRDCQPLDDKHRAQYHKYITIHWGVAQKAYGYTDFFYSSALQTAGWGTFRKEFNEDVLKKACPRMITTQAPSLPGIRQSPTLRVVQPLPSPPRPWWLFQRRFGG